MKRRAYEPNTLIERDLERLAEIVVHGWHRRDMAAMETIGEQVGYLMGRYSGSAAGGSTSCDDGPYSDGRNAEWWCFEFRHCGRGFNVAIRHELRETEVSTVLRSGLVTWREIVKRATGSTAADVGDQLELDLGVAA